MTSAPHDRECGPDSAMRAAAMSWSVDTRSALQRLDPTQSRVLQLLYFDRFSYQQVAEELSIARVAVSRQAASGMQALAALVGATAD